MKQILSILLLSSLPISTLANSPARQIGSALIKFVRYSQYMGRHGRYLKGECIASHALPLHENSENTHTIRLSQVSHDAATVYITPKSLSEAFIAIKFHQQNGTIKPTITQTAVNHSEPLNLDGGCVMERVPGGVSHSFDEIEVRLTKEVIPSEEIKE